MRHLLKYIEDILIVSGLILIIIAAFLLNKILGIFISGVTLFSLGVYFARFPLGRR